MEDSIGSFVARARRIRSALMVFAALILFLAGVLLLLAPASAQDEDSHLSFPSPSNGWIMGAHSHEPGFFARV